MASSEEDQLFAGAFNFIMDKYFRRSWINTSNCKVVELKLNLHTSRITFQKDCSYTWQFWTKVLAPSRLVSQAWAKYKSEVPDVSGCSQNVETSCKNKLKLTKLENLFFKKKMIVYNSNSKTLKFQWKRYCFSL